MKPTTLFPAIFCLSLTFGIASASLYAQAEGKAAAPVKKGPAFDRLAWLSELISRLKSAPTPSCVGPRGCAMSFAEDSPCLSPVLKQPDVIVDGVVPAGAKDTWVVAYRLMCSACYLGGAGFLATVRHAGQDVRILQTLPLRKETADEIPTVIEMTEQDVDNDNRSEILVQYGYVAENERKCTGMREASTFLLVLRAVKGQVSTLVDEQLAHRPLKKGRPFSTLFQFSDENDDGYPDLLLTRTMETELTCAQKGKKCNLIGEAARHTLQTVLPYSEEKGDWSAAPYTGYALAGGDDIHCAIPLPETPFAVVTGIYAAKALDEKMEADADAIRKAGFSRACIFNGGDYKGLGDKKLAVIAGAFSTRKAAEKAAADLRAAGFRPFVKEMF